jgi:hypothetical protein
VHPSAQDPEAEVSPETWITEIQTYLKDDILPDDSASTDRIAHLAKRYTLVGGDLYQCGTNCVIMEASAGTMHHPRRRAMTCSQRFVEVSVGTIHLPARWLVKPFGMAFTGLQPSRTPSSW